MIFHIISLFPELFDSFKNCSVLGKAIKNKKINLFIHNLRDFGVGVNKRVDDKPFGGGSGMLLKPDPIFFALEHIKKKYPPSYTILLDPKGRTYNNKKSISLAKKESVTLICGRYQGFDNRVNYFVDETISIGNYILSGGEIPAMVLIETISRRVKDVIGNQLSLEGESHQGQGLASPQYTRPRVFLDYKVPEVLLSGYHQKIKDWQKQCD